MPKVPLDESMNPPHLVRQANPELLRKDPMAEMFGPGSGVKLYGDPEDDIPDEIRALLDQHGLDKKPFQCMLKEIPAGCDLDNAGSAASSTYIKGFSRGIPSPDYVAREYGPGNYLLCFTWASKNEDGSRSSKHDQVPLNISEKVMGEFKRNRLSAKIKDATDVGSQVRDALVEKSIEGEMLKALTGKNSNTPDVDPKTSAKNYIAETIETAKMIGLTPYAQQPVVKSIEWDKILPAIMTGITAFLTMQQQAEMARRDESNKMLMLLMNSSQSANNQLLEVMKVQSGAGSGNMAIKEFKDMIFGALDIKEALSGNQKETLGDKIFRLVEGVAPSILSIAATTAQAAQAQNNPMVKMAKGYIETNPDFQALKKDPVEMKKTIDQMDRVYGWVQVDHILNTMGWERPENCPRVDEYKDPAPDDVKEDTSNIS